MASQKGAVSIVRTAL